MVRRSGLGGGGRRGPGGGTWRGPGGEEGRRGGVPCWACWAVGGVGLVLVGGYDEPGGGGEQSLRESERERTRDWFRNGTSERLGGRMLEQYSDMGWMIRLSTDTDTA